MFAFGPRTREARGGPPYDPRLMVRILLYAYTTGVRSSRVIERKCVDDVAFRWLAAGAAPDYRAIAGFRKRHLSALGHLFVQALALCQAAGIGGARWAGVRALDSDEGREDKGSGCRRSRTLLTDAERIDEAEDATFGKNSRGGEVAEQLRRRETGLAKIREAKAALEAEIGPRQDARRDTAPRRHDCETRRSGGAGRRALAGVDVRGRLRRRGAQDRHARPSTAHR